MNRMRTPLAILALTVWVLSLIAIAGCKRGTSAPAGGRTRQAPLFPVEVLRVDARAQELVVTAPGMVDAFERIQVTARVAGVIDKVMLAEGQVVKQGQPLAFIDSRRYALSVSSARAVLEKAEATAADTEQALKRRQNASASNPGLIRGEEIETYQTRLRTANADVSQAREAVKLAELNLADSRVKAQADGVIQTRNVQTGQYVQAGAIIATLLRRDPMLLRFSVSTAEAPRLKVGMPVDFELKESQRTYSATITLVADAADPDTRLVPIIAEVQSDHKFWLRPGSFAQVQVKLVSPRQFPMIPQSAARPSDHGFLAFVIEGDVARERVLELGLNTVDGWVEVKNGLSAGDVIVTRGGEALTDGAKVQIMAPDGGTGGAAGASGKRRGGMAGAASAVPLAADSAAVPSNDDVTAKGRAASNPVQGRGHRGSPSAAVSAVAPAEAP